MYSFNILVSCLWGYQQRARFEALRLLRGVGEEKPKVGKTLARGVLGVNITTLNNREVVKRLKEAVMVDPSILRFTMKWVPIDLWVNSDLPSLKEGVERLRGIIGAGERWRLTLEKRRYTEMHKIEIIRELAELIDEKVDLENPDNILRVEIIGKYAGLAVLLPEDVLSATKPY